MGCIYAKPNGGKPCFSWPWRRAAARNDLNSSARHIESMTVDEDKDGDVDAESGDEPTPLFSAADIDAGVPRLSRLSGQYLPPSGSRLATVPKYNFELRYSYLSQRGYYPEALDKANQDSFCIHTQFGRDPNDHFFGVFDGHGEYGTQCSQFVKKHLCENLLKDKHFMTDMEQAYHSAFIATNAQLHRHTIDDSMSGTTAITVLVRGKTLYVANVGDSRAVLAEKRGKDIIAMDLSSDQTPFRSDECARVKLCGARVLTLDQLEGLKNPNVQCWGGDEDDDGDPPRLWVANGMYPGTAFTRSIGDKIAEQIGVIAVPEVLVMELTPNNPFFVIASDGVFEFLTSQQVVDMVSQHTDPCNACAAVVAESYRLWLQYETRTDDITIIVVRINNLSGDTESGFGSTTLRQENNLSTNNLSTNNLSPPPFRAQRQMETRPVRHEISGARRKAIESSFHGSIKEPTLELHAKSAEDVAHIEKALQGNFLFNGLTEKQRHILYDCMEKLDVKAGDIIIRQGAEDSCFYIVASGEFEVLVSQSGDGGEQDLGTVVNHYTSDNFSCFGELALMYSKPRQSSVRAVKDGSLWTLKREVFRSVLSMHYSQESRIKTLRNVDILSHLTFPQLKRLSEAMTEMSFKKGEVFVRKDDEVCSLYVVNDGVVQLTYHEGATWTERKETSKLVNGGNCFGEWALLGDTSTRITATALTDVDCWMVSKLKFETDVGSLHEIIQEDKRLGDRINMLRKKNAPQINVEDFANVKLSDLEWQNTVYSTDCCEIGFVLRKGTSSVISMKRYWKKKLKLLGREAQALQEKMLMRQLRPSLFVPQVISTCADTEYAAILLNTCVVGPLSLVLRAPLDENSARFLAASAVVAVDLLHKDGVVYRGISPDILMLDDKGNLQLVDFRFAKKITNERTFTICGIADFLAPEILKGQGHGFAADWWALGVLIYFMLQNELPFGSWRDSELDIYAKVARGQLQIPDTFSSEVTDLLRKLLVVEEGYRLGSDERGVDLIKQHPWFHGLNWDDMLDCQVHVPKELQTRLELALESYHIEETAHFPDFGETNLKDLNTSLWLEDW